MNIVAITQKGPNKAENEDRIILGKNIIAEGVFQTQLANGIIAVADGVGGNNAGAVASHYGITVSACQAMITAARDAGSQDDISIVIGEI